MILRRFVLWIVLGMLGFTALIGLLATLPPFAFHVHLGIGSGILTAVTVGLLFFLSFHVERPQVRRGVLALITWIIIGYLFYMVMILSESRPNIHSSSSYFFYTSLGYWIFCGFPAAICLGGTVHSRTKIAGWTGTILATLIFLWFLTTTLFWTTVQYQSDYWYDYRRYNFSLILAKDLAACGAIIVACLIDINRRQGRWIRWTGVICATLAFLLLYSITCLNSFVFSPIAVHCFAGLLGVAAVIGLSNVMYAARLVGWQHAVRWLGIVAVACCAFTINLDVWGVPYQFADLVMRLTAASGIVGGCCILAVAILASLNRKAVQALCQ